MSTLDPREDILGYLHEHLLPSIAGWGSIWRNRGGLGDPQPPLPALILLDGDEDLAVDAEVIAAKKSVKMVPAPFILLPQIWAVLEPRDDRTNLTVDGLPDPVGPELSDWRIKIKTAVENDSGLIDLLGPHGQIIYLGCETDMKTRSTIGALGAQLLVRYQLRYVVFPPRA